MNHKSSNSANGVDLSLLRKKLKGTQGQQYWRSLDELAQTPEFEAMLHREFPTGASEWGDGLDRRSFFKLAAASLALAGLTACTKQPNAKILPYVKQPEQLVPGEPLFFATTMPFAGYGTGVLVKSREGHPIKVDGNPEHPSCLGASSIWMQASILDLYDPDRSQSVMHNGELSTWSSFLSEVNKLVIEHGHDHGKGLRLLSETITSPTLTSQIEALLKKFPDAKVYQFDSICRDNVRKGAQLAFGEIVEPHYRFDKAAVILSLESDFLYTHPQGLRYTRDFTNGRRLSAGQAKMNRLYVAESTPTITGTMADHRLPVASGEIQDLARELARLLGAAASQTANFKPEINAWLKALAADLQQNAGRSIVIAGEAQPPLVHAVAHLLNEKLGGSGNTVFYTDPAEAQAAMQLEGLSELVAELRDGSVTTLVIAGGNPVYSAPADFDIATLVRNTRRVIHLGTHLDETAAVCSWHIPQAHYLESWGDAKSFDGTVSLQQPLIEPLYGGKTAHELLDTLLLRQPVRSDYEIVRDFWRAKSRSPDFEKEWRHALHEGFIPGTESEPKKPQLKGDAIARAMGQATSAEIGTGQIEIIFRPDPSIWDGEFANNGWLQECPKPISKLTWDNAVIVSPAFAQSHQLANDDVVQLQCNEHGIRGPIWIQPGQAENSITLHLGYGRERVGRVGKGLGFNVNPLRTANSFWRIVGAVTLSKVGSRHHLAATQTHHNLHSPERQIYRQANLKDFLSDPKLIDKSTESPSVEHTLYDNREYKYDGYKWGMSIDLNTCIGCNACLLACNSENNIPVVGKDQVNRNREMHWIRIDTWHQGSVDNPEFSHMPVPCMHCEHAPCELVCPVEATVHDHEGLNLQVYNRCVGTRFCSNNCPYKVRRFNFLWYADYETQSFKAMYNPDVTVRWRGVMEKCTYCIQRISRARITAEKQNRRIREGEIQTACQQACPAQAIIFGDLNTTNSKVAQLKAHPLDYSMLGELNTRPRTTYLARVKNPNPDLEGNALS